MITCPLCGWDTRVTETRAVGATAKRRRACTQPGCRNRFTTIEMPLNNEGRPTHDSTLVLQRDLDDLARIVARLKEGDHV